MKNRRVAFAVLGATLLGLAVFLAARRNPARDAGPREEPAGVSEAVGALPSGVGPTLVIQGTVLDAFDTPLPGNGERKTLSIDLTTAVPEKASWAGVPRQQEASPLERKALAPLRDLAALFP